MYTFALLAVVNAAVADGFDHADLLRQIVASAASRSGDRMPGG